MSPVPLPPAPGPGRFDLTIVTPAFFVLSALLVVFVAFFLLLRRTHPKAQRALEGYLEAAGIDLGFLLFGLVLVLALVAHDPHGNRTSEALFEVILGGYWLSFSIPIVTVGSSIHARSKGAIPWRIPSVLVTALLFGAFFAYYYATS